MKQDTRLQKAKFSAISSLIYQLVTIVCGLITPRLFIGAYGSEAYGATTSVLQFLSYVTLIEGGIGGVARAALYKPLAENDTESVSNIYHSIKKFFGIVGIVFIGYTAIISVCYHGISDVETWDWVFTFFMVWVISMTTMAQYFFGIANLTLLNADHKQYINNVFSIITTLVNTVLIVVLIGLKYNILIVKFFSSCVFIIRPVVFMLYVKKTYNLTKPEKIDNSVLSQKWTGLGQHIAFFLHTNTDVVLLTVLADLRCVAVYAVYNMVVTSMRGVARAFSVGMESLFGNMIANKEDSALKESYSYYSNLLSTVSVILFATAAVLITSFVSIYTSNVSDADYIQPVFGLILLLAEAIDSIMIPCSTLPISANRFRQTRVGAYGEAIVNICLSFILIWWNPLLGVAIGTLAAVLFKVIFYIFYASRHIIRLSFIKTTGKILFDGLLIVGIYYLGSFLLSNIVLETLIHWIAVAIVVFICVIVITILANSVISPKKYPEFIKSFIKKKKA